MRAACWQGKYSVQVQNTPEPTIVNPRDIVIKVTATTAQVTCTANGASKRFGTVWR